MEGHSEPQNEKEELLYSLCDVFVENAKALGFDTVVIGVAENNKETGVLSGMSSFTGEGSDIMRCIYQMKMRLVTEANPGLGKALQGIAEAMESLFSEKPEALSSDAPSENPIIESPFLRAPKNRQIFEN